MWVFFAHRSVQCGVRQKKTEDRYIVTSTFLINTRAAKERFLNQAPNLPHWIRVRFPIWRRLHVTLYAISRGWHGNSDSGNTAVTVMTFCSNDIQRKNWTTNRCVSISFVKYLCPLWLPRRTQKSDGPLQILKFPEIDVQMFTLKFYKS